LDVAFKMRVYDDKSASSGDFVTPYWVFPE